jgi:hypothetical protein
MKAENLWFLLIIFCLKYVGLPAHAESLCENFDPEPPHFKKLYQQARELGREICLSFGDENVSDQVQQRFVAFAQTAAQSTAAAFAATRFAGEMEVQMQHFEDLAQAGMKKGKLPSFVTIENMQSDDDDAVFFGFADWNTEGYAILGDPGCQKSGGASCEQLFNSLKIAIEQYKKPFANLSGKDLAARTEILKGEEVPGTEQQVKDPIIEPPPPNIFDQLWEMLQRSNKFYVSLIIAVFLIFMFMIDPRGRRILQQLLRFTGKPVKGKIGTVYESIEPANQSEQYTIAEVGVSDAALDNPDNDLIGTSRLAKGLSLFLSHDKTEPPLTLAITGPWGSGKSSIMGMLKAYMAEARYRPVWFNVWHHQDEEHFFGALLESIRKDGIPPLWHFNGIIFRFRLMTNRLIQRPLLLVFLSLLVLLAVFPDHLLALLSLNDWKQQSRMVAAFLAGFTLLDQFAAFGFSSKDLAKGITSSFRTINFEADAGLRYRVRQCLQDIHQALGDRNMIIFIDDLDRCPPEHVLKVLEIVNFLSSPPLKFFIVFGISLEKVVPIISPSFAEQVEEEFPPVHGQDDETRKQTTRNERLKLARQYMRKMINIEVSVPVASVQELLELAKKDPKRPARIHTSQDAANRRARMLDQRVFPVGVVALLVSFLFLGPLGGLEQLQNLNLMPEKTEPVSNESGNPAAEPESQIASGSTDETGGASDTSDTSSKNNNQSDPKVEPYRPTLENVMPLVILFVSLVGVLGALLRRETQRAQIGDSDTFLQALDIWAPVLNALDPTPRHYIRMVNQLRLLSMRMRLERDALDKPIAQSIPSGELTDESVSQILSADDLKMVHTTVLSALHELGVDASKFMEQVPPVAQNSDDLLPVISKLKPSHLNPSELERAHAALSTSIAQHLERFPNIWPGEDDIDEFRTFMRGVQLS